MKYIEGNILVQKRLNMWMCFRIFFGRFCSWL